MTDDGSPYDDFLREGSMEKALGLFERKNKNGEQPGAGTGAGTGADAAPESGAGFGGKIGSYMQGRAEKKEQARLDKVHADSDAAQARHDEIYEAEHPEEFGPDKYSANNVEDTGAMEGRSSDLTPEGTSEDALDTREGGAHQRSRMEEPRRMGGANKKAMEGAGAGDVYAGRTDPENADEVAAKQLRQNEQAAADAEKQRRLSKEKTWAEEQDEAEKQNAENPDGTPETKDAGNPNVQPDSLIADPKQRQEQPPQDSMYQDPKAQDIYRRHAEKFLKAAGETAVENWGEGVSRGWDMAQNIVKMTLTHPSAMSSSSRLIGTALTGLQTASDFADKAAARYGMAADADPELVKDTLRYRLYRRDAKAGENVVGNTFRTISDSLARNGGDMADMSPSQLSAHMRDMQGEKDRLVAALQEPDLKPSDRRLLMGQAQHLQSYMTGIAKQAKSLQAQQNEANRYARVQDLDRRKVAYDTLPSGDPNPWSLVLHEASPKFNLEIDPQTGAPKTREGMNAAAKTIEGMIGRIEADAAMDPNTKAAYIAHLHGLLKQAYSTKERWDETSARTKASDFGSVMQDLAARFPALANDNGKRLRDLYEKGEWPSDGSVTLRALTARFAEMAASGDEETRNVGNLFLSSLNSYVNSSKLGNRIASYSLNDRNRAINGHVAELKAAQAHLDELAEEAADGTLTQEQAAEKAKYEARIAMERSLIEGLQKGVSDMNIDEGVLSDAYKDLHKVLFRSTRDDVTGARFDVNDPKVQEALARFDSVVRRYEYKYFNRLLDRGAAVRGVLDGQDGGGAPLPPPGGQGGRQVNPGRQRQRKKTPPADGTPDVADMSGYDESRPLDVGNATVYDRNGNPTLAKVVVDANGKPLPGEDGRLRFVALRGKEGGKRWVEIDGKGAYKGELYERKAPEGEGAGGDADVPPGGEDEASHDDAEDEAKPPEGEGAGLGGGDRQGDADEIPLDDAEGETEQPVDEQGASLDDTDDETTNEGTGYQKRWDARGRLPAKRKILERRYGILGLDGNRLTDADDDLILSNGFNEKDMSVPKQQGAANTRYSNLASFYKAHEKDMSPEFKRGLLLRMQNIRSIIGKSPEERKKTLMGKLLGEDGKVNEDFFADPDFARQSLDSLRFITVNKKGKLALNMNVIEKAGFDIDTRQALVARINRFLNAKQKIGVGRTGDADRDADDMDGIAPPETDMNTSPETPAFDPSKLDSRGSLNLGDSAAIKGYFRSIGLNPDDIDMNVIGKVTADMNLNDAMNTARDALYEYVKGEGVDTDALSDTQKKNLDDIGRALGNNAFHELKRSGESGDGEQGRGRDADDDQKKGDEQKSVPIVWPDTGNKAAKLAALYAATEAYRNDPGTETDLVAMYRAFVADPTMSIYRKKKDQKVKDFIDQAEAQAKAKGVSLEEVEKTKNDMKDDSNGKPPMDKDVENAYAVLRDSIMRWKGGRGDREKGKVETYAGLEEFMKNAATSLQTLARVQKKGKKDTEYANAVDSIANMFLDPYNGFRNNYLSFEKQYRDGQKAGLSDEDEGQKNLLRKMAIIRNSYNTLKAVLANDPNGFGNKLGEFDAVMHAVGKREEYGEAENKRENAEREANRENAHKNVKPIDPKEEVKTLGKLKGLDSKWNGAARLVSWLDAADKNDTDARNYAKSLRSMFYVTTKGGGYRLNRTLNRLNAFRGEKGDINKGKVDDLMAKYGLEPVFGTKPAKEESEPEPAPETGKDLWNQDRMIGVMGEVAGANDPGKRWDALEKILVHLDPEDDDADLSWLKDVDRNLLNDRIMPILRGYFYTTDDDGQLVPNDELRDKVDEDKRYMVDRVMEAYGQKPVFESEEQDGEEEKR